MILKPTFDQHIMMDVLMAERPELIPVILQLRMHCVGCLLTPFHSLADAAVEHNMDIDELLQKLLSVRCTQAD